MSDLVITVHKHEGFTDAEFNNYVGAVSKTQKVSNSKRFKDKFFKLKLTNTKGLTHQQIWDKIRSGAETLEPVPDNEVDVFINMYYKGNKVVGYTFPSTRETWVNRKFFSQYEHPEIGGNLFHEWLHKLGFDHASASEHTSVPYAVGYLMRDCIEEMENHPELYNDVEEVPAPQPEPTPEPKPEPIPEPEKPKKQVCKRLWYTLWTKKVCWYE